MIKGVAMDDSSHGMTAVMHWLAGCMLDRRPAGNIRLQGKSIRREINGKA